MLTTAIPGYVGPGPGLTMVWAFFALLGTICLALLSVLLWPIKMLIRKIRGSPPDTANESSIVSMDDAAVTPPAEGKTVD